MAKEINVGDVVLIRNEPLEELGPPLPQPDGGAAVRATVEELTDSHVTVWTHEGGKKLTVPRWAVLP